MSDEETQVVDNTDEPTGVDASESKPTYEELEAIVAKTRQEAAGKRIKNKEMQAKLEEYETWKRSQMSEVDRVKAEKEDLAREIAQLRSERLRESVASKVGLDPDLAQFIVGDSEAEMTANAKVLATKLGGGTTPRSAANAGMAGRRGKPVGTGADVSEEDWFRAQFDQ